MKQISISSALLAIGLAFADDSGVPIASIALSAQQSYVLAGSSIPVTAIPYNAVGAALSGRALQWSVSDSTIAAIDGSGNLQGIRPGAVDVAATDPGGGVAGHIGVYIYPGRFTVTLSSTSIEAGATTNATAQVLDAARNPINGVNVTFAIADPSLASVSGSTITGKAEGRTSVVARIDMGPGFDAYTTSVAFEITPRSDYTVKRLITTDTVTSTVTLGVPAHAAAFGNYAAAITSLSNGGQGIVLTKAGQKPKIIDSAGSLITGTTKVISYYSNIAVNANGDVAAVAYTPSEWCEMVILVYPASANWKPTVAFDSTNCNADIQPHALDAKGGLVYRFVQDYIHWNPDGTTVRLFGAGDSVAGLKPLNNLNAWGFSPFGTFLFLWVDQSNIINTMAWDGASKYTKLAATSGSITGQFISAAEMPAEINPGDFIQRVGSSNWTAIARFKGGAAATVVASSGANGLGWIQSNCDGVGEDIFFHADYNGGTNLFHINGTTYTTVSNFTLWREIGPVYAVSADTVWNFASTGTAPLTVQQYKGGAGTVVFGPGLAADGSANLGLTQNSFPRQMSASSPIFRTAGDFIMKWTGSGMTPLLKPGDALPGNRNLAYLQSFSTNRKGDFVISAQTQQGRSGIWAYKNGAMQLIAESDQVLGPGGSTTYQYAYCCDRTANYVAINSKGQIAAALGTQYNSLYFFDGTNTTATRVAQLAGAAPGGGVYNCCPQLQLNDSGHIAFGNNNNLYYWDGNTVSRVIGQGDTDPLGRPFNSVYTVVAAANGFYFTGNAPGYGNQVYALDPSGGGLQVLVTQNSVTSAGLLINSLFGPELSVDSSGNVFFPAYTASGNSILMRASDGSNKVGAIQSRKTADGDWLLLPYPGAATDTGDIFFPAYNWSGGAIRFGLYQATPR